MGAALHRTIAENYQKLTSTFSPSDNGGILNYAFEPFVDPVTKKVLLKTAPLSADSMLDMLEQMVIKSNHSVRVLDILPKDVQPETLEPPNYLTVAIFGGLAIVLAILMYLALMIAPCCLRKKSKKSVSKYNNICYIVAGILTIVFVVFLILCLPIAFSALSYFLSGVDPKQSGGGTPEVTQNLNVIFEQTKTFLAELVKNGTRLTDEMLVKVQDEITSGVTTLVHEILNQLMTTYGATKLIREVKILETDIKPLEKTTLFIATNVEGVVQEIEQLKTSMSNHKTTLTKNLQTLCAKPPLSTQQPKCDEMKDALKVINVDFDSTKIPTAIVKQMSSGVQTSAENLKKMLEEFTKLQTNMDKQTKQIIDSIKSKLNLAAQFSAISDMWVSFDKQLTIPVTEKLNAVRPQMDEALELAGKIGAIAGYVLLATYILVLAVIIIYVVLCAIEGFKRGLIRFHGDSEAEKEEDSGSPSKNKVVWGFVLPVLLAITIPIVVILAAVIVFLTGFINNEACRYMASSNGIKISDAALNLVVEYEWPELIAGGGLDAATMSMLQLTAPQNTLHALFVSCKPNVDATIHPGLFPSLGINNLINVTAVIDQPDIQNAVKESENTLVKEVLNLNLAQFLPANLNDLETKMKEIAKQLDTTDFKGSIDQLTSFIPNRGTIEAYLDKLLELIKLLPDSDTDAKSIRDTVVAIKTDLQKLDAITVKTNQLSDSFKLLIEYKPIVTKLNTFIVDIKQVAQVLQDNNEIEKPIRPIYKQGVKSMFDSLKTEMETQTTSFTKDVVSCDRINLVLTATVDMSCGTYGLLNRLGGFLLILLILVWALLVLIFVFQLYLGLHERHCLNE